MFLDGISVCMSLCIVKDAMLGGVCEKRIHYVVKSAIVLCGW